MTQYLRDVLKDWVKELEELPEHQINSKGILNYLKKLLDRDWNAGKVS